jgi:hypothetical protein
MVKVTFTLDDETVKKLRTMAQRAKKPQSLVVREAVAHYAAREQKIPPEERERLLRVLDEFRTKMPRKAREEINEELRELRHSRRTGWVRPWDR